jgi:hypothetical protein
MMTTNFEFSVDSSHSKQESCILPRIQGWDAGNLCSGDFNHGVDGIDDNAHDLAGRAAFRRFR